MCFFDSNNQKLNTQIIDGLQAVIAGGSLNAANVIDEWFQAVLNGQFVICADHNQAVRLAWFHNWGYSTLYAANCMYCNCAMMVNNFWQVQVCPNCLSYDNEVVTENEAKAHECALLVAKSETKVSDLDNEVRLELFVSMRSNLLTHEAAVVDAWAWGFEFSGLQSVACAGCGRVGLTSVSSRNYCCDGCIPF